jgi:hypothetical protein
MSRHILSGAALDMTKCSSVQIIVVCPSCNAGNRVGKNWFAGICRGCNKRFNKDDSLDCNSAVGEIKSASVSPINKIKVEIKSEMEKRAYAYAKERDDMTKTGKRVRAYNHILNRHFVGKRR